MRIMRRLCLMAALPLMAACAHPIVIGPDLTKLDNGSQPTRIDKKVGYYLTPEQKQLSVTTGGGGGDKVSYLPYRDLEAAIYKMLSNVFADVTPLRSANSSEIGSMPAMQYVIVPKVSTQSSSPSALTWPPTRFSVDLTCDVLDRSGAFVTTKTVHGEGAAEFEEFKSDHALSAKRASLDALLRMQASLANAPEIRK